MSAAQFEAACAQFCELAQVAATRPIPDDDGVLAFHVHWRGVTASVFFDPAQATDAAAIIFEIGPLDGLGQDPAQAMRALLASNYAPMRGAHSPTFACHPETGDAVLQCLHPIHDTAPGNLHKVMEAGVELVLRWRAALASHS